jgi:hypothetical protein
MTLHTVPGLLALAAVGAALAAAGSAHAQQTDRWRSFASLTPLYQSSAGIDGGGDFSTRGILFRAGTIGPMSAQTTTGVTFSYDYTDYRFGTPTFTGVHAPWGEVERVGLSFPLVMRPRESWNIGVTPSVDSFREKGGDWNESLSYGATFSVTRVFDQDRRLGLGVGVFERLEETRFFPYISVDWPLTARLRVTNPLPAGPTGPAGLELRYRLDRGWETGVGAAYRSYRFRLANDNPSVRDGIGEEDAVPVFLRVSRTLGPNYAVDFYAGALFGGRLRLEDSNGNRTSERDFDPAGLFAVSLSARF